MLLRWLALNLRGISTTSFSGRSRWLWRLERSLHCIPNWIRLRLPFHRVYVLYDLRRELLLESLKQISSQHYTKRVFFMIDDAIRQHDLDLLVNAIKDGFPNSVIILVLPSGSHLGADEDQIIINESGEIPFLTPEDFNGLKNLLLFEHRHVTEVAYKAEFVGSALTRLIGSSFWNVQPVIDSFRYPSDSKRLFQLICLSDAIGQRLPKSVAGRFFTNENRYRRALSSIRDYIKQNDTTPVELQLVVPWLSERLFEPSGQEALPRDVLESLLLDAVQACTCSEADFASSLLNGVREQGLLDTEALLRILNDAGHLISSVLIPASSFDASIRNWARTYRKLGNPQRAARICLRILQSPDAKMRRSARPLANHYAALCFRDLLDYHKSLTYLEQAISTIDQIPSNNREMQVKIRNAYAVLLRETRRMSEAQEQFELAYKLNPKNVINCIAFGTYWRHMGNIREADRYYSSAYILGGKETRLTVLLNQAKMALQKNIGYLPNPTQALYYLNEALQIEPSSLEAKCMLARCESIFYPQIEEPLKTLKTLADNGQAVAACELARVLMTQHQIKQAVECLQPFAETNGSDLTLRQFYARCLGDLGEVQLALLLYCNSFDGSKGQIIETSNTLAHRWRFAQFLLKHCEDISDAEQLALAELRPFARCEHFGGLRLRRIITDAAEVCGDLAYSRACCNPTLAMMAYSTALKAVVIGKRSVGDQYTRVRRKIAEVQRSLDDQGAVWK